MKILVTGGTGFVGSHIAEYYLLKGDEVVVYDSFTRSKLYKTKVDANEYNVNFLKKLGGDRLQVVKGDIRDYGRLLEASRDIEVIFHCAAQVAVTTSLIDPKLDFEINTLGTLNVLEVARKRDAAVVFTSTNKVYGENVNRVKIEEKETRYVFADPKFSRGIPETFSVDLSGHSPYGASKLAADIYVQEYYYTYGLKTGVFRMSCIYGERQFGVEDQGWVSWFIIATLTGRPITIYGDGKQVRDILYVKDLVLAFDKFISSKLKHEVFNIGGGPENSLSLIELIEILEKITGIRPEIKYAQWRPFDQKVYISDITKLNLLLNWKPKVSVLEGIKRVINWVQSNLYLFK